MTIEQYARALVEMAYNSGGGGYMVATPDVIDQIISRVPAPDVQAQIDAAFARGMAIGEQLVIDAARADEREACAKVADSHAWRIGTELAAEIRARSGAKGE